VPRRARWRCVADTTGRHAGLTLNRGHRAVGGGEQVIVEVVWDLVKLGPYATQPRQIRRPRQFHHDGQ
jgi:hypothetical protein